VGIAVAVMAVFTMLGAKKHRHGVGTAGRTATSAPTPRILVHDINDDRCTGCDACVAVCPTNVLDLVDNKSRVLRFEDCIQCEACMFACPTEALVMFPEGTAPPTLKVPELDEHYQTAVKGQYLIGEVAGKPLVKNAANLGRAVVEHMIQTGLRARRDVDVDVAIVGSGPGGLSAALTCIQRGLRYVVLEKEQLIASTIARYPKGKLVMAEPYDSENVSLLPVFDSSKEQLIPIWKELIERVGLQVKLGEAVEKIAKTGDGFELRTTVSSYRAQRVVLATGTRGKPRTLQVPGENLPKVANLLEDPDDHRGKTVLVVGGGDSAVEAALALADAGAKVLISYRGRAFNRAQPKNKQAIESYAAENRLKVKFNSQVAAFEPDTVVIQMGDGSQKRYPNQAAFILIGADPPVQWLGTLGVKFVDRPHQYALGKSDDLVRRFLPTVRACPDDAANAAIVVQGGVPDVDRAAAAISLPQAGAMRAPAAKAKQKQPEPVSGPRKWLRSATGLFTGSKKLEQPMPLSEFAKKQRFKTVHTGHGRRDALSPGERTRVLRMLRDEGARLADEDSRVELVPGGRGVRPIDNELSPPPEPKLEKTGRPMPPMHLDDDLPPKQAVIVGLAKAMAQGPTTARGKRQTQPPPAAMPPPVPGATPPGVTRSEAHAERERAKRPSGSPPPSQLPMPPPVPSAAPRGKRPSGPPPIAAAPPAAPVRPKKKSVPPPMEAEPTRKLDPNSPLAQMLRAANQAMPAVPAKGGFDDNETASHATRPAATRALAQSARPVAQRFDDESTRAADFDPRALDREVGADSQDELIDVGYLRGAHADGAIDLGHRDASGPFALDDATAVANVEKLAALERARTKQRTGTFEEPTRSADAAPVKSLSDVDWDLD
jgi:thioredoxin reductase/ferredoxin